ncbi:hypothetical protein [Alicyclobacillus hesperidum]|uniref:Uncharacterized protein n=1 Tax=Alicyclobacillus hesperidum TaxID=89784 RepID=A0A1H2UY66_9BACL|nr:hypothetical protein [Alicyclobacillus hesperidum]KRW92408.1 hypothetical protein SD51_02495 [Alicyclobacillus tengchongensis]SDW60958.1 hypothetical protein SAMN04489725_10957 [Alicyclobacillus hesperidum]
MRGTWMLAVGWIVVWIGITLLAGCVLARIWLNIDLPYAIYVIFNVCLVAAGLLLRWLAKRMDQ